MILVMLAPVFQVTGIQKEIDRYVEELEKPLKEREVLGTKKPRALKKTGRL